MTLQSVWWARGVNPLMAERETVSGVVVWRPSLSATSSFITVNAALVSRRAGTEALRPVAGLLSVACTARKTAGLLDVLGAA